MRQGILVRQGISARQEGTPGRGGLAAQALWHSTRWCHAFVGFGLGLESVHAQATCCVSSRPSLNRAFWERAVQYVVRHGAAPQLVYEDLNFDLNHLMRAPPSIPAALFVYRLVDADRELASVAGRPPFCSYQKPEGTRPSRIDGLLVDMRLAAPLHGAEVLPCGAIPSDTLVFFDLHLRGASRRVVNFVLPKPIKLVPREEHQRLLLVDRLLDPLEAGWQTALAAGDTDQAWTFLTTAAEETLLA